MPDRNPLSELSPARCYLNCYYYLNRPRSEDPATKRSHGSHEPQGIGPVKPGSISWPSTYDTWVLSTRPCRPDCPSIDSSMMVKLLTGPTPLRARTVGPIVKSGHTRSRSSGNGILLTRIESRTLASLVASSRCSWMQAASYYTLPSRRHQG